MATFSFLWRTACSGQPLTKVERDAERVFELSGMANIKIVEEIPGENRGPLDISAIMINGEIYDLEGQNHGLVGRNRIVFNGQTFRLDVIATGRDANSDPVSMAYAENQGFFIFPKNEFGRGFRFLGKNGDDILVVYR